MRRWWRRGGGEDEARPAGARAEAAQSSAAEAQVQIQWAGGAHGEGSALVAMLRHTGVGMCPR